MLPLDVVDNDIVVDIVVVENEVVDADEMCVSIVKAAVVGATQNIKKTSTSTVQQSPEVLMFVGVKNPP